VQGLGFPNPSVNRGSLSNGGGVGGLPAAAEEERPAESMARLWKVRRGERERERGTGNGKGREAVCQRAARFRRLQEAVTR
jgi:hypothetical protein